MSSTFIRIILVSLVPAMCISCRSDVTRNRHAEPADEAVFSAGQALIKAVFDLDEEKVKLLLHQSVDVNTRMGKHNRDLFKDRWTSGTPIASAYWTPLLAVAQSHEAPQPPSGFELLNTSEGLDAATEQLKKVDPKLIEERNTRRAAIGKALIAADANLNLHDGYGGTPLAHAVYNDYEELALLLINSGADVNTKTGSYIDGSGDITPIHRATKNVKLLKALLKHGADFRAQDSSGATPLHWATLGAHKESVRLLIAAGADVNIKDNEGKPPIHWVRTYGSIEFPGDRQTKEIEDMLIQAGAKRIKNTTDRIIEMLEQGGSAPDSADQ